MSLGRARRGPQKGEGTSIIPGRFLTHTSEEKLECVKEARVWVCLGKQREAELSGRRATEGGAWEALGPQALLEAALQMGAREA